MNIVSIISPLIDVSVGRRGGGWRMREGCIKRRRGSAQKSCGNVPSGTKDSRRGGWRFLGQGARLWGPNPGAQRIWAGCGPGWSAGGQALESPSRDSDRAGSRQLRAGPVLC